VRVSDCLATNGIVEDLHYYYFDEHIEEEEENDDIDDQTLMESWKSLLPPKFLEDLDAFEDRVVSGDVEGSDAQVRVGCVL
jgi:hypothetical protein